MIPLRPRLAFALLLPWLFGGCAVLELDPLPEPIRPARAPAEAAATDPAPPPEEETPAGARIVRVPGVVIQRTVAEGIVDRLGEDLTGDPVRVSFHDVPLIAFINAVFGDELGMSFVISPGLRDKADLVTLKLTEPLPPRRLFATARRVLREYGVDVQEAEEGILTFSASQEVASRDVPLLVSGRTLPEVPLSHRTIFQLVPLSVVRGPQVRGWLLEAFDRKDLKVMEDPDRNALLLRGSADMLARAIAMIEVLDQPLLRGRFGIIIEPVFMAAADLAGALNSVLRAEGYQSTLGVRGAASVILLPLAGVNKVVAFASDRDIVDHVEEWAEVLDTRQKETIEEAVFTYEVRNTQAEELTETLERMVGIQVAAGAPSEPAEAETGGREGGESRAATPAVAGARIVVDPRRNLVLFRGSGREWAEVRSVIEKLDRSVPSVLIEVLVAEITLDRRGEDRVRVSPQGRHREPRHHRRDPRRHRPQRGRPLRHPRQRRRGPRRPQPLLQGRSGGHPLPAPPPRQERRVREHRRRERDPRRHPVLGRRSRGRRNDHRPPGRHLPQDRGAARDQAPRPGQRPGGPPDLAAVERGAAGRRDRDSGTPRPSSTARSAPASPSEGRGLPRHGGAHLRQPERRRAGGPVARSDAGPRPALPYRHPAGGSHRAPRHGDPLRGRRPRGGLGAHPADPRAARSAHRDPAVIQRGPDLRARYGDVFNHRSSLRFSGLT